MVTAIASCHVGDVPDGIGTGCIEQRTARHGIGIATYVVYTGQTLIVAYPLLVCLIPVSRIEGIGFTYTVEVVALLLPLCCDIVIRNGIEKSCSVNTDGRFQFYTDFIDTYLSVFMELTSLAMTIEVLIAGISVRKYRKKLQEAKQSAG